MYVGARPCARIRILALPDQQHAQLQAFVFPGLHGGLHIGGHGGAKDQQVKATAQVVKQKVVSPQAHIGRWRAVGWTALKKRVVVARAVECGAGVFMRPRGAPVVERAHKGFGERERQHRVTQQPEAPARRRHEAGAFARFVNDFPGGAHALGAVAGQQALGRLPAADQAQAPGQGLRVLKAGVGTAHAKNRQQVRRVAHGQLSIRRR